MADTPKVRVRNGAVLRLKRQVGHCKEGTIVTLHAPQHLEDPDGYVTCNSLLLPAVPPHGPDIQVIADDFEVVHQDSEE